MIGRVDNSNRRRRVSPRTNVEPTKRSSESEYVERPRRQVPNNRRPPATVAVNTSNPIVAEVLEVFKLDNLDFSREYRDYYAEVFVELMNADMPGILHHVELPYKTMSILDKLVIDAQSNLNVVIDERVVEQREPVHTQDMRRQPSRSVQVRRSGNGNRR